jgi:hypothetical protein
MAEAGEAGRSSRHRAAVEPPPADEPTAAPVPPTWPGGSRPRAEAAARAALGVAMLPVTVAQQALPRSRPAVYYTGLAAAAVGGVIDWPVAVIAGAAVWALGQRHPTSEPR